jgi:hypothetical protein
MIGSAKKTGELQGKLNAENKKVVSNAIISLRNENPFRGAIGLLASLFDRTNDLIIKDLIRNFLNDIKEPGARMEVVAEIKKFYKPETISMLVSSCWQSGMDYSEFVIDFTNLFITGDYVIALECFTVIEESGQNIPASERSKIISLLERSHETSSVEKNSLLQALIKVLR